MKNVLNDDHIPGREGGAWVVKEGQHIRIEDVEGGPVGDFVSFNAANLDERFSQARTKANQGKFMLSVGDHLYTRDNNILFTIVEDTYGVHDLQYGMCSAWAYQKWQEGTFGGLDRSFTTGGPLGVPPFGCYEVLQKALKDWPIAPHNIPDPFNLFQTVKFDFETGEMVTVDARSKPGDYIDMVARMDALCGLSACPGAGKAMRVQIYEP